MYSFPCLEPLLKVLFIAWWQTTWQLMVWLALLKAFQENTFVGFVWRIVRMCSRQKLGLWHSASENKDLHKDHVKTAQENGTHCCGVKRACVFTKHLSHFNVLSAYPPDVLHDVL